MPDSGLSNSPKGIPSWVVQRRDTRYPQTLYLLGVGVSDQDRATADEKARLDLLKQIQVEIQSEETSVQLETSQQDAHQLSTTTQESRAESKIKTRVDTKVAGLTISERWSDDRGKKYYSLATLDREMAAKILENEIKIDLEAIEALFSSGRQHEENKQIGQALRDYHQAYLKRKALEISWQRYWVIKGETPDAGENTEARSKPKAGTSGSKGRAFDQLKTITEIKNRLDNLMAGIKIIPTEGNNQRGLPGYPLAKELMVTVILQRGEKERLPVVGLPIRFAFDDSSGLLEAEVITDAQGLAGSKVYRIEPLDNKILHKEANEAVNKSTNEVANKLANEAANTSVNTTTNKPKTISATIDLEGLDELREKRAVFTYLIPEELTASPVESSWSGGIIRLVEEIIAKITSAGVVRVAVLDFIEARSEKRLAWSRILEDDLRTTLARVEDLVLIDSGESQKNNPDLGSRPNNLA